LRVSIRQYAVNLLVFAVASILALIAAEIAIRLFASVPPAQSTLRTFTQYDPELGWKGTPGAKGVYTTENFSIPVSLNSGGWRDDEPSSPRSGASHAPEFNDAPSTGRRTIALLGDSYAWGFGVQREEMIADRLESLLPGWEVINYGVPGYGTDQELILLRRLLAEQVPTTVVVQVSLLNDLDTILNPVAYRLPKPRFRFSKSSLSLDGVPVRRLEDWEQISTSYMIKEFVTEHVHLYAWTRVRWRNLKAFFAGYFGMMDGSHEARTKILRKEVHHRVDKAWRLFEALLTEMKRESAGAGAELVLLVVSDSLQVDNGLWDKTLKAFGIDPAAHDRDLPNRRLEEIAGRLGIAVIDPLPVFRERTKRGEALFIAEDDPHWTAQGHDLAARLVAGYIAGRTADR
jgi:hypothetical protein